MRAKLYEWHEIRVQWETMERMSCKPTEIKKIPKGTIIDENQTIVWNRQYIEKNNEEYLEEVARLNSEKNRRRDEIKEMIYRRIQNDIGHQISRDKAIRIWEYAYGQWHDAGIHRVICELEELVELLEAVVAL